MRRDALIREAEVLSYEVLGRPVLPALQRITDLARDLFGMRMAEVNVVTALHTVHLATSDRHEGRVPVVHSFCSRVVEQPGRTFVVPDATRDPVFKDGPYVDGRFGAIVTYAGTQLISPDGVVYGTLCVWDDEEHPLDPRDLAVLEQLGDLASLVLEQHRTTSRIAEGLRELADSHRWVDRSNESLASLAGQLGHDLRTPLATLRLSLSLISERAAAVDDPLIGRLADQAREGSDRLGRTVDELLEFALVGGDLQTGPVDLHAVLVEVLDDLTSAVEGIHVSAEQLPVVLGHRSSLAAVLQNLVANALKFGVRAGDETAHVRVRAERTGGVARVTVDDTGPGVPVELREMIFARGERGVRRDKDGFGIGLATCQRIVRHLGGAIGVTDSDLGGASFWFEVPLATPSPEAAA